MYAQKNICTKAHPGKIQIPRKLCFLRRTSFPNCRVKQLASRKKKKKIMKISPSFNRPKHRTLITLRADSHFSLRVTPASRSARSLSALYPACILRNTRRPTSASLMMILTRPAARGSLSSSLPFLDFASARGAGWR